MKLRWPVLVAVVTAVLVAVGSVPWGVAERTLEKRMMAVLARDLGLTASARGGGSFAFLPVPRMIARDVTVQDTTGQWQAQLPRVRADLDLVALITGRLAFRHLHLSAPQLDLSIDVDPQVLSSGGPLSSLVSTRFADRPATPHISVTDGGSVFFRRGGVIQSSIRAIQLDVAARDQGEAAQIAGRAIWRGEAVQFAIATNSQARLTTPTAIIASELLNLTFTAGSARPAGTAGEQSAPVASLEGQLRVSTPSASRLASWIATPSPILLPQIGRASCRERV